MLRLHFTPEDLRRTRLAAGPLPRWEAVLSLYRLRDPRPDPVFAAWRRLAFREAGTSTRRLLKAVDELYGPDLLDKALAGAQGWAWPESARLRQHEHDSAPQAAHDQANLDDLTDLEAYYGSVLAPHWPDIVLAISLDLARRTTSLAFSGIDELLDGLDLQSRWSPPYLEIPYRLDDACHLCGRGLLIVPSFFCPPHPILLKEFAPRPALVYPIRHYATSRGSTSRRRRALSALVGHTRAMLLSTLDRGSCTTTGLAQTSGVSLASASEHATILRESGLITSQRHGACVVHTISRVGKAVIHGEYLPIAMLEPKTVLSNQLSNHSVSRQASRIARTA